MPVRLSRPIYNNRTVSTGSQKANYNIYVLAAFMNGVSRAIIGSTTVVPYHHFQAIVNHLKIWGR